LFIDESKLLLNQVNDLYFGTINEEEELYIYIE